MKNSNLIWSIIIVILFAAVSISVFGIVFRILWAIVSNRIFLALFLLLISIGIGIYFGYGEYRKTKK